MRAPEPLPTFQRADAAPWPEQSRHLVAAVAFDSQAQPCFVGLRAAAAPARRVLFQAEGHELDLEIRSDSTNGLLDLVGQIIGPEATSGDGWLLLSRPTLDRLARIDASGEFQLTGIEAGVYRLEVVFKDRLVEVPLLPL